MMKMTSYVTSPRNRIETDSNRNNVNGQSNPKSGVKSGQSETFTSFVYFLFAPTLLYRSSYPRTKSIDWKAVINRSTNLAASLFISMLFTTRFLIPTFSKIGHSMTTTDLMNMMFVSLFHGVFTYWMLFYGFFESYLNLTAELTKFSDRQFYRDFWNFTDVVANFRQWNTITYNFIYECIYSPIVRNTNGNKTVASLFVVTLSTILHEYIMAMCLGFSIPWIWIVSFWFMLLFGRQMIQTFEKLQIFGSSPSDKNYNLYVGLASTWSLLSFLYTAEYYSRINCPIQSPSIHDYITLNIINCIRIK